MKREVWSVPGIAREISSRSDHFVPPGQLRQNAGIEVSLDRMKIYLVGGAVRDELLGLPVRERLEYVAAARTFASQELGLPDNDSYRSYADLGRPYVVWNVFATDEFSVQPRRWAPSCAPRPPVKSP